MKVYVVNNSDLGWDYIVGVFDASKFTKKEIKVVFPSWKNYFVDERTVEDSLNDWLD